jgi:hypothetical protein
MVLDESFESSLSSTMWEVSSATTSTVCGASHLSKALRFTGTASSERYVQTKYWDVSSGGQWQFDLKYADASTAGCSAVQSSLVSFEYNVASRNKWVVIDTYPRVDFMYVPDTEGCC